MKNNKWSEVLVEKYSKTSPPSCEACGYTEGLHMYPVARRLKEIGRTKYQMHYVKAVMDENFPPWGIVLCALHGRMLRSGFLWAKFPHLKAPN